MASDGNEDSSFDLLSVFYLFIFPVYHNSHESSWGTGKIKKLGCELLGNLTSLYCLYLMLNSHFDPDTAG